MRRTSAKLLSAIIGTHQDLLGQLYTNVASSLINHFKEREETVRVEILQTLTLIGGAEYEIDTSFESIAKRRKGSRPEIPSGYTLPKLLVMVLKGGLETAYILFVNASILKAIPEVSSLLRKGHRPLKVASLHFLDVAIRQYVNCDHCVHSFLHFCFGP